MLKSIDGSELIHSPKNLSQRIAEHEIERKTVTDYEERQTQLLQAYMDIFLSNDTDQSVESFRKASVLEATVCKSFL